MSVCGTVLRNFSRWWLVKRKAFVFIYAWTILQFTYADDINLTEKNGHIANINVSFKNGDGSKKEFFTGKYAVHGPIKNFKGVVLLAPALFNRTGHLVHHGCTQYNNSKFPSENWIALVERGECLFKTKLKVAADDHKASAIIIYNDSVGKDLKGLPVYDQNNEYPDVAAVTISRENGLEIKRLLVDGFTATMEVSPAESDSQSSGMHNNISKTSVLFVSISFIVLMIISLAWLVFYYIQRFRYSHAKERLARRLVCAAKKAIAKIPQRTVKVGDKELDCEFDQCAVCIEPYKAHDVIRIMPCRHVFHKSCVDPWLLDQRSCPMCKLDILRAFGMQIGSSQESVHHDTEAVATTTVVPEPEVSSSVEDTQTEEIKVLLVPHTCLHFRSSREKVPADDEEAMSSLLGAIGGSVPHSSSLSSLNSKGSRLSRTEKVEKSENASSEGIALIEKGSGKWRSHEKCDDEDDDVDDIAIRKVEHILDVIETVRKKKVIKRHIGDEIVYVDIPSVSSFPKSSLPAYHQDTNPQHFKTDLDMRDQDTNITNDSVIVIDNHNDEETVKVEFHKIDDDVATEPKA